MPRIIIIVINADVILLVMIHLGHNDVAYMPGDYIMKFLF